MTSQEAFNKVWDWFVVKKNAASVTYVVGIEVNCAYRGENNTKCAVGIFIPDEMYDPRIEGMSYRLLFDNRPDIACLFSGLTDRFICQLQMAHDEAAVKTACNPEGFTYEIERHLRGLASAWELRIPEE